MIKIYTFTEHDVTVSGEEHHMRELAEILRDAEGTLGDLRYKIEYEFDIDGIKSADRSEAVKEIATWAAESAFQSLSDARGGDNLVTTDDDSSLCEFAFDSFENNGETWTEDDLDMADSIISKRIWELTTVAE